MRYLLRYIFLGTAYVSSIWWYFDRYYILRARVESLNYVLLHFNSEKLCVPLRPRQGGLILMNCYRLYASPHKTVDMRVIEYNTSRKKKIKQKWHGHQTVDGKYIFIQRWKNMSRQNGMTEVVRYEFLQG